jgi:hypothetical protein
MHSVPVRTSTMCRPISRSAFASFCRLFLFLSFAYRLFLFSVLLFLDRRHPTGGLAHALAGGLAQAFAARSGSCSRRRCGSSFRRAVWLMLSPAVLLKLSPRPMLSPAVLLKLSPHAFCLCLSPVASSPRSRASSSSAFPVLLGL